MSKRQFRLMSLAEAVTNVIVGYALAVTVQVILFPKIGMTSASDRIS